MKFLHIFVALCLIGLSQGWFWARRSSSTRTTTTSRPTTTTSSCYDWTRLTHAEAARKLGSIRLSSTGRCSDRENGVCTSLDTIRCKCIKDIVALQRDSGCSLTITGGTETGHTPGPQSHYNGYKLDISLGICINNYITRSFSSHGQRSDGTKLYKDYSKGNIYAKETKLNHWDIKYP